MTSDDRAPEATAAIKLCEIWAKDLSAKIPCKVYLFGSAIYDGGDQFDPQLSDLDLVIVFDDVLDATERAERLLTLRQHKSWLELQLVPCLHRINCEDPGVSVVPITTTELRANVHKSGARRFFDRNIYLELNTGMESVGLPDAGTSSIGDEARQALEYTQNIRNQFLAVSANGTGGIAPFDGADPVPKALARVAAQLVPDPTIGSWYDTRFGLELIWEELASRRSESEAIIKLYHKISKRRGGRGRQLPLYDFDQLLLAEILYERAASAPLEPIATWEIRFSGLVPTPERREYLLQELRSLVPDGEILGVFEGSIIVRLRSSMRSYHTVKRLQEAVALSAYFGVEHVSVMAVDTEAGPGDFGPRGAIERIAERISSWRPRSVDSMAATEAKLTRWLESWLHDDATLADAFITREALIGHTERPLRADILMQFREMGQEQHVVIELARLRSRSSFFQQVDRVRRIQLPTILVLLGTLDQLSGLAADIRKLSTTDSGLHIVPVQLDNG